MTTYAHLLPMPVGDLFTAVDESGAVLRLQFAAYRDCGGLTAGLKRPIEWNADRCAHVERQLAEYFGGRRRVFDLEIDLQGSSFQKEVWSELQRIPFGATINYRQLANRLGRPAATRAVGRASAGNPICIVVPCHRVIGANGALTGFGGGVDIKRFLLQHERSGADRTLRAGRGEPAHEVISDGASPFPRRNSGAGRKRLVHVSEKEGEVGLND